MEVTFYGVRGSCPCSGEAYQGVGGNTSCVLVRLPGEDPLVLDLGTGLRALGQALMAGPEPPPSHTNALLTHLHFDHILGLPFFGPLRNPDGVVDVYGPRQEGSLAETLRRVVQPPFFPVEMGAFQGKIRLHDVDEGTMALGGAKVTARTVPHPGNTLGYRVEMEGRAVAYIPDHQAPPDRRSVDPGVRDLCDGADLVIHDAQYSDDEYVAHPDWGHSTVAYAVRVAAVSGARRLVLYHHDPGHSDQAVARLLEAARQLPDAKGLELVEAAREGERIDLGKE